MKRKELLHHGKLPMRYDSESSLVRGCTIHEEDVPVIVRRRGCTMRLRIQSFTDEFDKVRLKPKKKTTRN